MNMFINRKSDECKKKKKHRNCNKGQRKVEAIYDVVGADLKLLNKWRIKAILNIFFDKYVIVSTCIF